MAENTKEKNKQPAITAIILVISAIFAGLGLVLLFVPQIQILTVIYLLGGVFIITGIVFIVQYFLKEAYRNMNQYGFSAGTLLVILGSCMMVRAGQVAEYFILGMGIFLLIAAVIKLQNALDLKALGERIWVLFCLLAAAIAVCALIIILDPFTQPADRNHFTYIILVADGVFTLISMLFLMLRVKKYQKTKNDEKVQHTKDIDTKDDIEEEIIQTRSDSSDDEWEPVGNNTERNE
ncbi:MAG: DUF308 domain-containing protein [Lachnospiraceae bacterium]|nr:DUF308 domain-containing protein [Lachnospiraceae bacterium]